MSTAPPRGRYATARILGSLVASALLVTTLCLSQYKPALLATPFRSIQQLSDNKIPELFGTAASKDAPFKETLEYAIQTLPQVFSPTYANDSDHVFSWPDTATIDLERLVIVAHWHEDLKWLKSVPTPWKIISKDDPQNPDNVNSNNHTEASAYLYFLVKYYDALPHNMAFVHGHGMSQTQWPQGRPEAKDLDQYDDTELTAEDLAVDARTVKRPATPEDIERMPVWRDHNYRAINRHEVEVSCNTNHAEEGGSLVWFGKRGNRPYAASEVNVTTASEPLSDGTQGFYDLWEFLQRPWQQGGLGMHLPRIITSKCCSTFTIDRDTARRVPREAYLRLLVWLEGDRRKSTGNAMEYIWNVLFNQGHWKS